MQVKNSHRSDKQKSRAIEQEDGMPSFGRQSHSGDIKEMVAK
jgi:hypothetical protein